MKVNEIFYSVQGEGKLAGVPSVFVRLAGCHLQCWWCDTKYAWDESAGQEYSVEEIIEKVRQWPCRFAVVTGGEPMISEELPKLLMVLKKAGKHVTIETAGIIFLPGLACELMSISPKLSNSVSDKTKAGGLKENLRFNPAVLRKLIDNYEYQLKFVVEREADLDEIEEAIRRIGNVDRSRVMLMPQARMRQELLEKSGMVAEMCKRTGFMFSPRLQVFLWDGERGK